MITVKNVSSGHIGRVTERDYNLIAGADWIRVNEAPPKKPMEPKKPASTEDDTPQWAEPEGELTKEQLIEKLRPLGLKGLHLYSLEKLKETYENQTP